VSVPVQLIIDEAIRFECGLSSLYLQFHEASSEDADLWWGISVSEQGHASLLESGRKLFSDEFSREMVDADLDGLRRSNQELESLIQRLGEEPMDREETFRVAIAFEDDPNERIVFDLLEIEGSNPAQELVDSIHREDSMHARRIRAYRSKHGFAES